MFVPHNNPSVRLSHTLHLNCSCCMSTDVNVMSFQTVYMNYSIVHLVALHCLCYMINYLVCVQMAVIVSKPIVCAWWLLNIHVCSPCLCLSLSLSLSLSVALSLSLSVSVSLSASLSVCLSVFVSLTLSLFVYVFVSLSLYASVSVSLFLFLSVSVSLRGCSDGPAGPAMAGPLFALRHF